MQFNRGSGRTPGASPARAARRAHGNHRTAGSAPRGRNVLVAFVLALLAATVFASSASATLKAVGPVDPLPTGTGFPLFYTDQNNLSMQPCLDGPAICLAARADLIDAHAAGGDGEAFYYSADADLALSRTDTAQTITVHNALEASYAAAG